MFKQKASPRRATPIETLASARRRIEDAELRKTEARSRVSRYIAGIRVSQAENILLALESQVTRPLEEILEMPENGRNIYAEMLATGERKRRAEGGIARLIAEIHSGRATKRFVKSARQTGARVLEAAKKQQVSEIE